MALFLAGKDLNDIVKELMGMTHRADKPYQQQPRKVQTVTREELRRRRGKETA